MKTSIDTQNLKSFNGSIIPAAVELNDDGSCEAIYDHEDTCTVQYFSTVDAFCFAHGVSVNDWADLVD